MPSGPVRISARAWLIVWVRWARAVRLDGHQRPDRLHRAVTSSWRSGRPAGLGGAGSTDRIERVGLALAAPVLPVRAIHFHDPDPGRRNVPGQARAIAASPLDPDQAHRAEAVQPAQ
jgi:hypothetical protein